ncbi:MAG: alpha/beta hydrolase [Spirochaetales bacterium]|jgi:fermentation-respiration switch protein FrsA (DUF1100 family)|nr:alpha/beta hydrolase [Spirochaetales bacterium]
MRQNKGRPALLLALILLFLFLVSAGGGTYLFHFALARKGPAHEESAVDADELAAESRTEGRSWMRSAPFERLSIRAKDGARLAGYYFTAPQSGGPPLRLAVLVHGYGTNAWLMADYARFYLDAGFDVFAPDNRAHGASEGNWIGMGRLDRDDLLRWLDLLIEKAGSGCEIVMHGISMGASAIMMASSGLPPQVKCLIADCGYTSAGDEFAWQLEQMFGLPPFPLLYIASLESKIIAGYGFAEASALKEITKSRAPVFFIHGADDEFNPTSMALELYAAASCEKELWIVPGAEHAMAYYVNPGEYIRRVLDFCGKYLRGAAIK